MRDRSLVDTVLLFVNQPVRQLFAFYRRGRLAGDPGIKRLLWDGQPIMALPDTIYGANGGGRAGKQRS